MKTTKELIIADITAKVEAKLASQKVELSSIKELTLQLKVLQSLESELLKSAEKYMDTLTILEKQYQIANGVRNSANRAVSDSLAIIKDFKGKANALGLDGSNVKEVKDLDVMIKKTLTNQKDFDTSITKPK
jgi:hypothetical protein